MRYVKSDCDYPRGGEEANQGCGSLPAVALRVPRRARRRRPGAAVPRSSVPPSAHRLSQLEDGPCRRKDAMDWPVRMASMNHLVPAPLRSPGRCRRRLAQLCAGREPCANPAVMSPPGRANTLLAMVLVLGQPPADPWQTEWPGKARQSMDSIGPPARAGCPGKSRPGKGSGSEQD
jgi:hypothetical protein